MRFRDHRILGLLLVAITVCIYAQSLGNEFVTWDDGGLVYNNPAIKELTSWSLTRIFTSYDPELYIPLTLLTYQVEHFFFGLNTTVFHATNLVLHSANVLLVYWFLLLILKTKYAKWLAFLTALYFTVHPLQTEAIAWVSSRKDLLCVFLYLSSLISYIHYKRGGNRRLFHASIVLFLLALLSKAVALSLLPVLLLIDWYEREATANIQSVRADHPALFTKSAGAVNRAKDWISEVASREKWPYLALSLVFGFVALGGKSENLLNMTLWEYFLVICKSIFFYITQLIVPGHFSVLYEQNTPITIASLEFVVPIVILTLITGGAVAAYKKYPILTFCWAWYILNLIPSLFNFYKQNYIFFSSDRYAYLPSVGIFLAILWVGSELLQKVPKGHWRITVATIAVAITAIPLALRSYDRSKDWASTVALFGSDVEAGHPSFIAHGNLGAIYVTQGKYEEAIELLEKSIAIRDDVGIAYATLGDAYGKIGEYEKGLGYLIRGLELDPRKGRNLEYFKPLIDQYRSRKL